MVLHAMTRGAARPVAKSAISRRFAVSQGKTARSSISIRRYPVTAPDHSRLLRKLGRGA